MLKTLRRPRGGAALRTLAITPLLALALTACGAGGNDDSGGKQNSGAGSSDADTASQEWYVKYATCMREAGIDMPDPGTGGGMVSSRDTATEAGQAADAACRAKLPEQPAPPTGDPGDVAAGQAEALRLASCLRDLGYDVPDPKPNEGLGIGDTPQEALEKCGSNVATSP